MTIPWICLAGAFAAQSAEPPNAAPPFPGALERAAIALATMHEPINDALLIGNGDLNGLLYAEGDDLIIRLTKNDVWDARIDTELDPPLPTLKRVLELGNGTWPDKNWVLPEGITWTEPDSYNANAYPCPRACAVVRIKGGARDAMAKLDIERAVATIRGAAGVVLIRVHGEKNALWISSDVPLQVEIEPIISEEIPEPKHANLQSHAWIQQAIPGDLDWPGMEFAVACVTLDSAAAVTVVTSLESDSPRRAAIDLAQSTLTRDPAECLAEHERTWFDFWRKSGLSLADETLERVWYRNLYFLRCVTKQGVVSPGLFAGLLTDAPAWHGDYHTNYNLQQTFWSAYSANHCDLTEPYDRLITEYLPRARWIAREVYGLDGGYFPHVLYAYEPRNPASCKSPNGRQYFHHVWAFTLGVSGFTVQPLWWHYLHEPDPVFLEESAYPALREVALFYAGFIDRCPRQSGKLVLGPSVSPEHWGWTDGFERNRDCAFDIAYFHAVFDAAIEAAGILNRDVRLVQRWRTAKQLLPPYPTAADDPTLVVDVAGAPPIEYNIPVPTTPVFPAEVVTFQSPPDQRELFTRTLERLEHNGNNAPVMLAVTRARLDTADAYDWLRTELDRRERRNGTLSFNRLDPKYRFNDFGHYTEMFGAVLPITELLMQSVGGVIRVFPAWPNHLPASFTTLRARGGFLVSAVHEAGKTVSVEIQSTAGGRMQLLRPWASTECQQDDGAWAATNSDETGIIAFDTQAGDTLRFRESGA